MVYIAIDVDSHANFNDLENLLFYAKYNMKLFMGQEGAVGSAQSISSLILKESDIRMC